MNAVIYIWETNFPSTYQIFIGNPIKPQYKDLVN